jgi:hypothetical protein
MATKEKFKVTKTEEIELEFYAVRSKDGKWFRTKGYQGYGNSWVDDIAKARIYAKPGPATTQVTYWAKHYPQYGVPDLVRIKTGKVEYLDQSDAVKERIDKQKRKKLAQEISNSEYSINNYIQKSKIDQEYVDRMKSNIEKLKKELEELKKQ